MSVFIMIILIVASLVLIATVLMQEGNKQGLVDDFVFGDHDSSRAA